MPDDYDTDILWEDFKCSLYEDRLLWSLKDCLIDGCLDYLSWRICSWDDLLSREFSLFLDIDWSISGPDIFKLFNWMGENTWEFSPILFLCNIGAYFVCC